MHDEDELGARDVEFGEEPVEVELPGREEGGLQVGALEDFFDFDVIFPGVGEAPRFLEGAVGVGERGAGGLRWGFRMELWSWFW